MRNRQRGDTIVEVLLAMSVVGLVLGTAFGIANRSVNLGQDAQERTEALKLAESQLELLKSRYSSDASIRTRTDVQPFCFEASVLFSVKESTDAACKNQNGRGAAGLYSIAIIPPASSSLTATYEIRIIWNRLGATGQNNLSLYYKVGAI